VLDFFKITPKKRRVLIKSKKGVIYSNPPFTKKIIFYLGSFLFVVAVSFLAYLYWPIIFVSGRYYFLSHDKTQNMYLVPTLIPTPSPMIGQKSPVDTEYSVTIPKIVAHSNIVPDVPPFDKNEYLKVLENDVVAQAKGSHPPGSGLGKMTYIFAHSTQQGIDMVRKNAVFYLLGEMNHDDIFWIKYLGKIYIYKVYDKKVVSASEIEYLTFSDNNFEVVILQTCWPIGTDWKRLLVFGKRVN